MTEYEILTGTPVEQSYMEDVYIPVEQLASELITLRNGFYVCTDKSMFIDYKDAQYWQELILMSPKNIDINTKENELMMYAIFKIVEYCANEFGVLYKYGDSDIMDIGLAYTTITDNEIPIQVCADLVNCSISTYLFDTLVNMRKYDSLYDLIKEELDDLDFDNLTSVTDAEIAMVKDCI